MSILVAQINYVLALSSIQIKIINCAQIYFLSVSWYLSINNWCYKGNILLFSKNLENNNFFVFFKITKIKFNFQSIKQINIIENGRITK